ncbi:MAG: glycosyltransferase, partial [Caldithrix sp.]|nr:glycosyltransferase [Caldithrix sp.]
GIDILLQSLSEIDSKIPVLFIGGKNESEIEQFKQYVRRYKNVDHVIVTGWLSKKEMRPYLEQTLIGVLPLQSTFFNRFITSPLKLFDYYSYSIPVVASDLPTTRSLIKAGETGLLFEPGNAEELAEAVNTIIHDENRLKNMQHAVAEHARQFLWEKRAKRIKEISREVQIL